MTVVSLDDRTVGFVTAVNHCCFRCNIKDEGREVTVRWDGVLNVQLRNVSLIYVFGEPHRYPCAVHATPLVPFLFPAAAGCAADAGTRSAGSALLQAPDRQPDAVHACA